MTAPSAGPPAVVLVHGALTDASVWRGVIAELSKDGLVITAPSLPMRGLHSDAAYLRAYLSSRRGPLIVVGHSYAGAVLSHPAALTDAVRALVFVAAFQADAGETAGELNARYPGSLLTPDNLLVREYPGGREVSLQPDRFAQVYGADLTPAEAAIRAVSQKPFDPTSLAESFDDPATWHALPSWAVVSTADVSIPTQTLRWMAHRAGSTVVEVDSSHAVPISRPDVVADAIRDAVVGAGR